MFVHGGGGVGGLILLEEISNKTSVPKVGIEII